MSYGFLLSCFYYDHCLTSAVLGIPSHLLKTLKSHITSFQRFYSSSQACFFPPQNQGRTLCLYYISYSIAKLYLWLFSPSPVIHSFKAAHVLPVFVLHIQVQFLGDTRCSINSDFRLTGKNIIYVSFSSQLRIMLMLRNTCGCGMKCLHKTTLYF